MILLKKSFLWLKKNIMIKVISIDIGGTLVRGPKKKHNYGLKDLTSLVELPYDDVRNAYKNIFQKERGSFEILVSKFCQTLGIKVNKELNDFFEKLEKVNVLVPKTENYNHFSYELNNILTIKINIFITQIINNY